MGVSLQSILRVGGDSVGLNLGQNERRYYAECVGDRS